MYTLVNGLTNKAYVAKTNDWTFVGCTGEVKKLINEKINLRHDIVTRRPNVFEVFMVESLLRRVSLTRIVNEKFLWKSL